MPAAGRSERALVLVADDEEVVRRVAKVGLEHFGHEVICARDGQEALEIFRARADEIDVVVLDATMPRLDGDGAMRKIVELRPDAKIILSSGYKEASRTPPPGTPRPAAFLGKPYTAENLEHLVREVLRG